MASTLWKLTALAGVMGAGSFVVYQAQTNLAHKSTEERSNPDSEEFHSPEEAGSEPTLASASDSEGTLPTPESAPPPPQGDDLWDAAPSESVPTLTDTTTNDQFNPFAGEPEESSEAPAPPAEPQVTRPPSRFADLVASLSDTGSVESADNENADDSSPHASPEAATEINPFGSSPSEDLAAADAEQDRPGTAAEVNPFAFENESSDAPPNDAAESDLSRQDTPDAQVELESGRSDTGARLDGLSRLDAEDPGPQLMAPPVDVTGQASGDPAGLADLTAEAAPRKPGPSYFPRLEDDSSVVQTSGENASPSADEPKPLLILPGTNPPPATRANEPVDPGAPSRTVPRDSAPGEPSLFSENPGPQPGTNEVPSDDGALSIEVPVQARGRNNANPFGNVANEPPAAPTSPSDRGNADEFNPFADPSDTAQTPPTRRSEPNLFPSMPKEPASQSPAESPRLDPAPAHSLAEESAPSNNRPERSVPQPQLNPENLLGNGTIGRDSPIGTQQAQVTIEKEAPADAVVGQPLVYSIHVRNIGRAAAENVVVKDVTPRGSRLVGTIPQAELDESNGKLIWRLGRIGPAELRTIRIKVVPTNAGQIGSVATVSFEAAVAARTVITAPELKVTIDGPEEVSVGEKAAYRFILTNTGSADSAGTYIRNLIPEGFEHPRGTDLEYDIGVLPKGQSKEVQLTLLAVKPGQYENRAVLAADGDVSVEAVKLVSVLASRLSVHREGPADRFVGRSARFTNTVTNESSSLMADVTVVETVPVGVEFKEASDGGIYDPQRRTVTWRLQNLDSGAQRPLHIAVVPTEAAEYTSIVKAFDARGHAAEVTGRMRVAGFSSLKVDFSHDGVPVPVGEEVALRLSVKNRGTAPARQVRTLVEIPPEMRFVEARGPVRYRLVGSSLIEFEAVNTLEIDGEQQFEILLAALQKGDARVRVELQADELSSPLNQEELVVIHPNQE